jgi:hypothetical protein
MFRAYLQCVYDTLLRGRRPARFPKAVRTTPRPGAHLRVEGLEARELLTAYPLVFHLDLGESALSLTGYDSVTQRDLTPQRNGSLVTQYSGTLNSLYDPTAHTLQFLLSGSTLDAANNGSWNPTLSGDDGSQPANYGAYAEQDFIVPLEWSHLALRDIGGGLSNASPVSVAGGSIAPAETLNITTGGLAYRYAGTEYIASGSTIVRAMASNSNASAGSFQDLGSSFHIAVPINVAFNVFTAGGNWAALSLSGTLNATATFCLAAVSNGVLTAANTGPAATITLSHAGSTTTVCGANFADNSYSSVVLNTGTGHDTVNIENTLTGKPMTVNDGSGGDDVYVSPTARNLNNIQGTVTVHGNASGIDSLVVNDQNNGSSQTFTLGIDSVTRGSAAVFYDNLANYVTVKGGNGGNTFNVQALAGSYLSMTLVAGAFNNVFNVGSAANSLDSIQAPLYVTGGAGINTLNINDQGTGGARTYTVSGSGVSRSLAATISYGAIQALTVNTGANSSDVANVWSTSVPTKVIGHASSTVNVGFAGKTLGIQADLTITDPPANALATVNVDDSADPNFRTPTLDTVTNIFEYGRVHGLSQGDILYRYVDTSSATIQTGTGGASVAIKATGKPVNLIGNPSGAVSLYASDLDNTWSITGQNAGTLNIAQSPATVTFSSVQNLAGGAGADTFVFADGAGVDGAIDGGGGTNTLDYSAYSSSVLVDLQTGSATGVGGGILNNSIQNVTGGTGGGDAGMFNLLIGNGGNVLTGGFGRRNILVAGGAASTLNAGDQEDLLIAGSTVYDGDPALAAWSQIAAEWASSDDYATRVLKLGTGNGVPLLDATTVFGNGGGNTLNGTGALAWIFSDGLDTINNFDSNSPTVPINP